MSLTEPATHTSSPPIRQSTRHNTIPIWLNDFFSVSHLYPYKYLFLITSTIQLLKTRGFSSRLPSFVNNVAPILELVPFSQASKNAQWVTIMQQELQVLEQNGTQILTTLPKGKKLICSKWMYKVKFKPSGVIDRFKVQLVAKGCNQIEGIDYKNRSHRWQKWAQLECLLILPL